MLWKNAECELWLQKHSEVRPQGGQVYNSKALQRVAGEPAVLKSVSSAGSSFLSYKLFNVIILSHTPLTSPA